MALYNKNPNINPEIGAPASATPKGSPAVEPKKSFLDVVGQKMAAITNLMGQEGSEALTPNQFALKIYRTTKK